MSIDRRSFLQLLGSSALAATFSESIARALSIAPNSQTGTIQDVEHIVILMQENRSFDHYFGTLSGVRGFSDPRAVRLPNGHSVWRQPDGQGGAVLPFHPTAPELGMEFLQDLPHDWSSTHAAWNQGNYDRWVPNKGPVTMAHLTRADIPFHYALADAFTICDAYHCSVMGATFPNRHHMWTGWSGNDGQHNGPALDNSTPEFNWATYPEALQQAGVSWKIYQDQGGGLDAAHAWGGRDNDPYIGNYGCNTLLYFQAYQQALPGSPLFQRARTGTNVAAGGTLFDIFKQDAQTGQLPQVSWVLAPEAHTEHPNWPANYGAWFVSQILDALTANPEVWSKTAFFLTYDENDGFFDHMVPPTPPETSAQGLSSIDVSNEFFAGDTKFPAGPYGLGPRVPMIVISPWSRGGWVNSQVFDHTSMIRFIQARFGGQYSGLEQNNITKWRSAVTGDLTSAFNFATLNAATISLPSTASYVPPDNKRHADFPTNPPQTQVLPTQEPGIRPACALPYELNTEGNANLTAGTFTISFQNTGTQAAVFQVRMNSNGYYPRTYTVGPSTTLSDTWQITGAGETSYEFFVYGPNGFYRSYQGEMIDSTGANLQATLTYNIAQVGVLLTAQNVGSAPCKLGLIDRYSGNSWSSLLEPGGVFEQSFALAASSGWYDYAVSIQGEGDNTFQQEFAGHLETGAASVTDPGYKNTAG